MGGEPLFALPPRVLVAGRLQCGAARAGVRRGRGECAELAHLAPRLHDWFYARHAEKRTFSEEVGRNTILAMCTAARYLTHYKEADNADTATKSYAVGVVGQGQGWRPFSPFFVRVALAGISLLACAGCASMPAGAASRYALGAGGVGAARPAPAASLISASRYVLGARRSAERHRPSPP